ncbi:MAG: hypothetical protein IPP55_16580, partial [Anaerolineales bacterium]|nr:hypothetical protein [Anaerolineales bacterium]
QPRRLPSSKGRPMDDSLDFLAECGLSVQKLNPRQYQAKMPALPEIDLLFQRPRDIVVSVRQGSVDFGITGIDCSKKIAATTARSSSYMMNSVMAAARSCSPSPKRG